MRAGASAGPPGIAGSAGASVTGRWAKPRRLRGPRSLRPTTWAAPSTASTPPWIASERNRSSRTLSGGREPARSGGAGRPLTVSPPGTSTPPGPGLTVPNQRPLAATVIHGLPPHRAGTCASSQIHRHAWCNTRLMPSRHERGRRPRIYPRRGRRVRLRRRPRVAPPTHVSPRVAEGPCPKILANGASRDSAEYYA